MLKKLKTSYLLLIFILLLASCGPVHRFTRLKKTPREYTFNYCKENIRAPKSDFDKQLWVVFSDRDGNPSYVNPGGKVKLKEFGFMDAFLVLKKKGEYYRLIKYDPEVINNMYSKNLKDRKKVEYCGWIHQSKLLLTRQTVTDIASGFKNKQLTIITDSATVSNPKDFFVTDSIVTFKDENLINTHGVAPFYSIVYTLKTSPDKEKTLIAKKTIISPDSAKTDVLGWIPSSLLKSVGQRLHVDLSTLPDSLLIFKDISRKDTLPISQWDLDESRLFNTKISPLKFNPVSFYKRTDKDTISLRTGITVPIIDNRDNYVFNVNGNKIPYDKFKDFERDFRKMNILFILEGHESVLQSYAEITNVIQNLQPLFENGDDHYSYKFGTVLTSQGLSADSRPKIKTTGLLNNYTQLMDSLIAETESKDVKRPIPNQYAWSGVEKAVDLLKSHKDETNILVIIGGTGYSEWADSTLVRRIGDLNCKILGFQMHGVKEVAGNNFVLQIENMIEKSSKRISDAKKEKIVYINQVKPRNLFRESSKNVFKLDYPNRSMSQGWILFPEKEANLPLNVLTNSIDSLISEVKWDNENLISSLYKAFNTVGKQRNLYGSIFAQYNDIDGPRTLDKSFARKLSEQIPMAYLPSQKINLPDSLNQEAKYHLLLSKEELDNLILFIEDLSSIEVDIKYKGEKKQKKRDYCNCSEDEEDDLYENNIKASSNDTIKTIEYLSTRKLRSQLQKTYMNELNTCKLCKRSKKVMMQYDLGEAQRLITGCPSYSTLLKQYTIKDIRNKKKIPDAELDILIQYLKQKKENLIKSLPDMDKFESNGETYYWVSQRMLP